jgi:rhamnulokinase
VPVYATASHDTASAVAAVPAMEESNWCYISSGTWSLLGVEIDEPIVSERALALNFTNEVGASGKIRLLKNIAGLWLLQECRRAWALGGRDFSYAELAEMAEAAPPSSARIDPNAFLTPGNMPDQITHYCRKSGQAAPAQPGPMCRMILESLAYSYRDVIINLEGLLGRSFDVIHIVGGGSRNRLLNQLTADFSRKTVIAGPTEATAVGNILVQAMGASSVSNLTEARRIVRKSFPLQTFTPR